MKNGEIMNLYDMILDGNSNEKVLNIDEICQQFKLSKDEYYDLCNNIINHRDLMNVDVNGKCRVYEKQDLKNNYKDNFIKSFEKVLNNDLLEDIFEVLNNKDFKYDLKQIGVNYSGWADEQLFIQSFLLQKIYQYMIMNRENIKKEEFINEYYNYLRQICESSESFEEILNKCDYILINDIIQKVKLNENSEEGLKEKILILLKQRYINQGYCFHGFNSSFEDNILKYGLSGKFSCCDVEDMKKIDNILRKKGLTNSFQQNWDYQVQPNFFTTDNFGASYYYSVLSPVFLSRLVSNGKYMIDVKIYNRKAFFERNTNECINNVELLLSKYNVSNVEKEKIITYLNNLLKSVLSERNNLKIAFMQRANIGRNFSLNYDKALLMKNILPIEDLILLALTPAFELDRHQNVTYSPDIIETISIPNFTKKLKKTRT